ncbi:malonate decarboxylase holo-ACP synthase [Pseudomonas viridiflava]|uniref:malonate decarboxylase holo-ACP synthase n=1 Tax=Pseudomonas viridiflava TaxID=33069 RepID=UPI0018E5D7E0|nr:malonate decarboxylase holo-ACP synthase [Pseudomonas viridiflava]MBI6703354.1 malonate decarboxylase holo-ACP synthase [Pseudomonas viridiflava]MBI6725286.1 malonate decarboxylase holo-ACP synthase [Pseudomonas viridiflava]
MSSAVLPHDLLWGMPLSALPEDAPEWAVEAALAGRPVVVRRQVVAAGQVAVGLRGDAREQRYAAIMACADISRRVSPEQLVDVVDGCLHDWPALRALRLIRPVMDSLELSWGVGGSAGFELASGFSALHQGSDLDLILRTPQPVERCWAAELVEALETVVCRIDVQLQLEQGAVALREWARPSGRVLLKSANGARLVADPWQLAEVCA